MKRARPVIRSVTQGRRAREDDEADEAARADDNKNSGICAAKRLVRPVMRAVRRSGHCQPQIGAEAADGCNTAKAVRAPVVADAALEACSVDIIYSIARGFLASAT